VRFVAVSQPHAGAFLNAVPKWAHFRIPTCHMRVAVQRRLGLPLLAAAGSLDRRSAHGKAFDCYGDVAQCDGEEGHATRHHLVLEALVKVVRGVWGGRVQMEPSAHEDYSDTRPDLAAMGCGKGGAMLVADTKLYDDLGGDGLPGCRGAYVAFGNTRPRARETVLGLAQRGEARQPLWSWARGSGYVPPKKGQYDRALQVGVDVRPLLFSTFGGFSPEVTEFLKELTQERANKLNTSEYDSTTWSARTWMTFSAQKLSVAVHMAATGELIRALGLAAAADPRAG
jgi:hypothetical protein